MNASATLPPSTPRRIAPWHWALPFVLGALTTPIWLNWYEPQLFLALNSAFANLPAHFWALLSLFGTGWAIYAITAPALWRAPRILLAWLCAAPLAGLFTRFGKEFFFTPRPLEVLDGIDIHVIGEPLYIASMPSGHTLTAFAGAAAIYFTLNPQHRRRWLALFVFALGVACSRVAVGAHWPADTAAGAAMGLLSGLTGAWVAGKIPAQQLRPQAWLMRGVALLGVYCVYVLWTDEMGFFDINMPAQYLLGTFLAISLLLFARHSLRRD